MQGGAESSEFRIPDSELEGSVPLRVSSPPPAQVSRVPSDKILFPRRMLYLEAVLYLFLALGAFGLGFLAAKRGSTTADSEGAEIQKRVPVEGTVVVPDSRRGDKSAVIIAFPADEKPEKPLDFTAFRPDKSFSLKTAEKLIEPCRGAVAQADKDGNFVLMVPAAKKYLLLVLSKAGDRKPFAAQADALAAQRDMERLSPYLGDARSLLEGSRYRLLEKDLRPYPRIEVELRD